MNIASFLKISTALPVAAMLALAGCGGGSNGTATGPGGNGSGGGSDDDPPVMAKPASPAPPAGVTTNGLTPSAAERTVATGSTTLAALFSAQPGKAYSPVSGALKRASGTTSLDGVLHVRSVERTSAGGYLIHYTDGETPQPLTIEFDPGDCRPGYCETRENGYHGLWAWTSADGEPLGSPGFSHMHALNLIANPTGNDESRIAFVFGLTTPPATLSTLGEAVYSGSTRMDAYRTGDSAANLRQRYSGNVRIVANFDMSQLNGTVLNVQGSEPGSNIRNPLPTSSFLISDGKIHDNGQFTATLAGMDSDDSVADKDSVRGVMGRILGEFYGPEGSMIGGAVTASRDLDGDDNDLTFYGYFRGEKEREITIDSSTQLSSLVNRNYPSSETTIATPASAMVETIAEGYRVTFTIDGVQKAVDVTEADLGGIGGNIYNFEKIVETESVSRRFYLWRYSGSFPGRPRFEYLDVNGVILSDYMPGVPQDIPNLNDVTSGYIVRGTRTSTNDMPTGSASYSGEMHAREWPTDSLSNFTDADEYRGDFSMTADFAAGTVAGTVSNVHSRPSFTGTYTSSPSTGLTFQGTVNGNEITASALTGTGTFAEYSGMAKGAFYGPAAAEVGGVFEGTATDKLLQGYFAGDK